MSLNFSVQPDEPKDKRYCNLCMRKEPPVTTELILNVNINQYRWDTNRNTCNDCTNERAREYRTGGKAKYADYLQQLHDETIDEFTIQWEDPAYRKSRIADRLYKVLDRYGRRTPATGIRKSWILEVIMKELWFIDANEIVEDYFNEFNWSQTKRIPAKQILLQFVVHRLEFLQELYRRIAENRFAGIVDTINREHEGVDKLVATPNHTDPTTKEMIDNWYLLSREQERNWREQMREEKKARFDLITNQEKIIVETREVEVARQKQEKDSAKNGDQGQAQPDTNNNGSKKGESDQ
jgi:hypothetical protein